MTSGHLFVVRGDLTTISSDAVLVPSDWWLNVTEHWWGLFRPEDLEDSVGGWKRYVGGGAHDLSEHALRVGSSPYWLFPAAHDAPSSLAEAAARAVRRAAEALDEPQGSARLVTLPLPGTGAGGLAHRRGEVVDHLLPALRATARDAGLDIALVLADDRDEAAVQRSRRDGYWDVLPDDLLGRADALGELAAQGRLSLFLGAGVSTPLGLPDWTTLVTDLRRQASLDAPWDDAPAAAQEAVDLLGEDALASIVRDGFRVSRCTLAHALLAGLRIREAVTTNYDTAYEVAVDGIRRERRRGVKVLTRTVVDPARPWLLKLHGDADSGRGIVLTRRQYDRFLEHGTPLRGMVQSLLMTSHLMFVGYSLVDETFSVLARQVRDVVKDADEPRGRVGTVLPIMEDDQIRERCGEDLAYLPMPAGPGEAPEGARLLSVFLDRVGWRASQSRLDALQYLVDERYAGVQRSPEDEALKRLVQEVLAGAGPDARGSDGWQHLAAALRRLGADV